VVGHFDSARFTSVRQDGARILVGFHWGLIEWPTEHAIRRIERTMKTSKTIDQLFEEFLADQKARLSPKTYARYEQIIFLYRSYLERYWPGHSHKEYDAITSAQGTYCGTFGP
jgi:hypothetical protein